MASPSPTLAPAIHSRLEQLDGLRGIAALTVVLLHLTIVFQLNQGPLYAFLDQTAWRVIYAGHEAVILFFVLSGFVLSLPFFGGRQGTYFQFAIRRVCRIWLPYLVAITIAAISSYSIYHYLAPTGAQPSPNMLRTLLHHYWLIGEFNYNAFDGPVWSLVMEMRISLLFPLLVWLVIRLKWYWIIAAAIALSVDGNLLHHWLMPADTLLTNYFDTMHYAAFFLLGALLARQREQATYIIRRIEPWMGLLIPLAAIYLYTNLLISYPAHLQILKPGDWGTALGAIILLAYALGSSYASKALTIAPVAFLGKISYSLYLYHLIVIFLLAALLKGHSGARIEVAISLVLATTVAYAAWRLVEKPAIRFGRVTAQRVGKRSPLQLPAWMLGQQAAAPTASD